MNPAVIKLDTAKAIDRNPGLDLLPDNRFIEVAPEIRTGSLARVPPSSCSSQGHCLQA